MIKRTGLPMILLFLLFATACKKQKDTTVPVPVPPPVTINYPNPLGPLGADPGVILANGNYYFYFTSGNSIPIVSA